MSGDSSSEAIYQKFIRRHPRFKLIQNKRWGLALLPLPDRFEEYLRGRSKQVVRSKRSRCLGMGFRFARIDPLKHLDEILAINLSMPERQGRAMSRDYLEMDALRIHFENSPNVFGVLDEDGGVKAYADAIISGEVAILNRLLAHGEELVNGVMYLCVSEIVRVMVERKADQGMPKWLLYDTLLGSSTGLRYFKERLGFKPYKVSWVWSP
jgi:hypothetical protein